MYAVMGSTGQVGARVASALLDQGEAVLLPLRDPARADALVQRGARTHRVDYERADELAAAFAAAPAGAFVMLPPLFDPSPGFPEARARIAALRAALARSPPAKIVALSTIGADAAPSNLLSQLGLLEQALETLPLPVTMLRAAWFMDNAAFDLRDARERGVIDSFLQPIDRGIPMVAAADVGLAAAQLLGESWHGTRVVELQGPARVSPQQLAATFSSVLGRAVCAAPVARSGWAAAFSAQGMQHPGPRMRMLDGFNEGWIGFADDGRGARRGTTPLEQVIRALADG